MHEIGRATTPEQFDELFGRVDRGETSKLNLLQITMDSKEIRPANPPGEKQSRVAEREDGDSKRDGRPKFAGPCFPTGDSPRAQPTRESSYKFDGRTVKSEEWDYEDGSNETRLTLSDGEIELTQTRPTKGGDPEVDFDKSCFKKFNDGHVEISYSSNNKCSTEKIYPSGTIDRAEYDERTFRTLSESSDSVDRKIAQGRIDTVTKLITK